MPLEPLLQEKLGGHQKRAKKWKIVWVWRKVEKRRLEKRDQRQL